MSTYEVLLFLHILFVIVWVGGGVMIQLFYLRARLAGPEQLGRFTGDVEWIGQRVITPVALLVLIFGILLVIDQEAFELSQFWVWIGLVMFGISFATGAGFLGPESGRIKNLLESQGPDAPDTQRRIARILTISRIELVLLILIVLDMVVKPGL